MLILAGLFLLGLWLPAALRPRCSNPPRHARVDGRTIYIDQAGDNCTRGIPERNSVDQLHQLNSKLDENCTLIEGQELLVDHCRLCDPNRLGVADGVAFTATPTCLSLVQQKCILL
ncbi:MAG: hypothetical protein IPJ46_04355 [Anaerolineales bacterium]|nr:hypothetical protein [Anaerolineales bacterium]